MKKKWHIIEEQVVTNQWKYLVEAETKEEAIQMIKDGDVECYDYIFGDESLHSPINIIEIEEVKE
jgi:hypothetical protein